MKIKKYNRYPLSNSFMFIGLLIAFLAVICGCSLYENIEVNNKESKNFKYDNEIVVNYFSMDGSLLKLDNFAKNETINTEVTMFAMGVGKYTRVVDIAYSYNEDPPYSLKSGRLPSKEDIAAGRKVVNIGQGLTSDVYQRDGDEYIKFDGIEYEVIGYFGSENSNVLDSAIYFVYNCLDDYHKKMLEEQDVFFVRYGSNSNDVYSVVSDVTSNLVANIDYSIEDATSYNTNITSKHNKDMYYFTIYAFAIGICIIISELWIFERKDEIAILKTIGFSNSRIVNKLYLSIAGIMLIAMAAAYVVLIAFELITGNQMISMSGFSKVIAFMLLSSILIFIVPIMKINMIAPSECVNSRGNY